MTPRDRVQQIHGMADRMRLMRFGETQIFKAAHSEVAGAVLHAKARSDSQGMVAGFIIIGVDQKTAGFIVQRTI